MKYYLVGIKGTGMSALAIYLKQLGNDVCGSDVDDYYFTEENLRNNDIKIFKFGQKLITEYIYIVSSAYDEENIDVKALKKNQIPYLYYHQFIGNLQNGDLIAVSGTHGKTTTSKFLSQMIDCSCIIGDGTGQGKSDVEYFVLEACEYKEHFLSYVPKLLLITNIELDHPDFYRNIEQMIASYQKLVNQSDLVIINGDDLNCKKLKIKNVIKVGISNNCDYQYEIIEKSLDYTKVKILVQNNEYKVTIPFVGDHLVFDFVIAYVCCLVLGEKPSFTNLCLPKKRMMEYQYGHTILIDDYAHHPTEIKALYQSLREKYPNYIINTIFQPHTYTRTLTFQNEFNYALSLFNNCYICDVFTSQRETNNKMYQNKINQIFKNFPKFKESVLEKIDRNKFELWVFLGAGTISNYIKSFLKI